MTTHKKTHTTKHEPAVLAEANAPEKTTNKFDTVLNALIMLGILLVVGLAVVVMAPDIKKRFAAGGTKPSSTATAIQATTVEGITVKSELSPETAAGAVSFMKTALKPEDIPQELTFQSIGKADETRGLSAVANWNKNGKFVSVLAGSTKENKPAYFRIWTMPTGESVTEAQAKSFLSNLFSPAFLKNFPDKITCQGVQNPVDASALTECAAMKTIESGDLVGVTVRAPITLQPPPGAPAPSGVTNPKVIIVSACSVPKEGTTFYPSPNCQ